ncbi:hypothetical protein VTK73DRAFT_6041 [Phialemonium thermophilum]|uniref:Uncharacterized protein n=1 Tax=Phialemonium thermophilum TaxID=223376 RepID=A0ABR3XX75_9PEZI
MPFPKIDCRCVPRRYFVATLWSPTSWTCYSFGRAPKLWRKQEATYPTPPAFEPTNYLGGYWPGLHFQFHWVFADNTCFLYCNPYFPPFFSPFFFSRFLSLQREKRPEKQIGLLLPPPAWPNPSLDRAVFRNLGSCVGILVSIASKLPRRAESQTTMYFPPRPLPPFLYPCGLV